MAEGYSSTDHLTRNQHTVCDGGYCISHYQTPLGRFSELDCSTIDMLTSPVAAARVAVATGEWVKSKHDMYLVRGSVGA